MVLFHLVFTGSGDGTVRVYNTKSGSCKRIFKGHEHAVNALVVSIHHRELAHKGNILHYDVIWSYIETYMTLWRHTIYAA
jgi:WD40 repeat protein